MTGRPAILLLGWMALLSPAEEAVAEPAGETIHVRIDTSEWIHYPGYLVFTYMTSVPSRVPIGDGNRVGIRNLIHDGQMGQDDSIGGVLGGKSNALAVQPYAWVIDPDEVPAILCDAPPCRYNYTEVPVNFAKRYGLDPDAVWLGTYIEFDLELPAAPYTDPDLPLSEC